MTQTLIHSTVIFDEYDHTYTTQDGHPLSGVTSLLHRQLFAHKYDNIPDFVLKKAAEYGTGVHRRIQLCDTLGVVPENDPVVSAYNAFKVELGLKTLVNEYLVSDNVNVASSIDVVFDDYSLCDIKTTSKLDRDYLSWQLSIYAYLFEMQNPGLKVPRLLACWLPKKRYGKPCMEIIQRITAEECARLIAIDAAGGSYTISNSLPSEEHVNEIAVRSEVVDAVIGFETQIKDLTAKRDELKAGLLELMVRNGVKNWKSDDGRLTLAVRKGGETQRFDSARFRKEMPDLYGKYVKTSEISDSLTIKVS